jgi:putative chitinase
MIRFDAGHTRDIVRYCESERLLLRQTAYVLATAWHETAHTMLPIPEIGKGKGRPYGKPAGKWGNAYYGRGYVQLTWIDNYIKMGDVVGVNLAQFPEMALTAEVAIKILVIGMRRGMFTGRKLDDFITPTKCDYIQARKIVNGRDRAEMIAGYAAEYERWLDDTGYGQPDPVVVAKPAAPAPAPHKTPPLSRWARVKAWFRTWIA